MQPQRRNRKPPPDFYGMTILAEQRARERFWPYPTPDDCRYTGGRDINHDRGKAKTADKELRL